MSITALCFAIFYIYGLFLAFWKRPIFGLYVYIFTFYLHPPGQWWGQSLPNIRWSLIAGILTLVAILFDRNKKQRGWLEYPETKLILLFVAYNITQYFWALSQPVHLEFIVLSLKFFILFIIIQRSVLNINDVIGFIISNLIGCAYIGYRGYGGGLLENMGLPGLDGSNLLAQQFSVVLIFSGFLFLCNFSLKLKALLIPLIILVVNGIILSESRSVVISLVVSGLFMILFSPAKPKGFYKYVLLGAMAFTVLMGPRMIEKMSTLNLGGSPEEIRDSSAESRLVIIKSQLEMIKDSSFFGYGHRGTFLLSANYIPHEYHTSGGRSSHNTIMSLGVDHGIGGVFYLLIAVISIIRIRSIPEYSSASVSDKNLAIMLKGLIISLVCFWVAGLGTNNKVIELDIWLYAIIPVVHDMVQKSRGSAFTELSSLEIKRKRTGQS